MADDNKPKSIIVIPDLDRSQPQAPGAPLPRSKPMRTREELATIVQRLTQNAELMQQLRGAIGSDDKRRMSAAIDEIERVAQTVDPTITNPEAVRITVLLAKIIGQPGGPIK